MNASPASNTRTRVSAANGLCRPGGKLCVGRSNSHASLQTESAHAPPCKSAKLYDATTYTQFATWAAVDCLVRRAVLREREAGETHCKSAGNGRRSRGCRVKCKNLWGPSGSNKDWRCEPLSFAYFSLRRQRKVGAAPHRGNACEPITSRGCQQKAKSNRAANLPPRKTQEHPSIATCTTRRATFPPSLTNEMPNARTRCPATHCPCVRS